MMTTRTKLALQISAIIVLSCAFALIPAFAGGDDCRQGHRQCGHDNGDGGGDQTQGQQQGQAQGQQQGQGQTQSQTAEASAAAAAAANATSTSTADSTATASGGTGGEGGAGGHAESNSAVGDTTATGGSSEATGGSVGDINVNTGNNIPANTTHKSDIRIENTPDSVTITPGSGDRCKAHIGANLSIPGLGTGLTIPLPGKECRKLNYYDRMIAIGDTNAAEIIFCSLKEVKTEFRQLDLPCRDTLSIHTEEPDPDLTGQVIIPEDEYNSLLLAQVQQEEVEELEDKYMEQQALIDDLKEEIADHDLEQEEIDQLKRQAAELSAAQQAREKERADFRAAAKARLAAREEQGSEEEDPNE